MNHVPDLTSQLNLDAKFSRSPFGGNHRTILITKTFSSTGDFAFNNLLHHFSRKEPKTPILLVTLSQNWANYSASAAKCGHNLRKSTNGGNIEVLNIMDLLYESIKKVDNEPTDASRTRLQMRDDRTLDGCDLTHETIISKIRSFISKHSEPLDQVYGETCPAPSNNTTMKHVIIMIDDLTILRAVGFSECDVYKIFSTLDKELRDRSQKLPETSLSHFIVQATTIKAGGHDMRGVDKLLTNYSLSNMENLSDLCISLKPLDTGYSPRVDGTVKIIDNRLQAHQRLSTETPPSSSGSSLSKQGDCLDATQPAPKFQFTPMTSSSLFRGNQAGDIGAKRAFFYKLGDRRARLTSSALII